MSRAFRDQPTGYRSAPSASYPDYRGRSAGDGVYWVPPDPAIGDVISAWTNQTSAGFRSHLTAKIWFARIVGALTLVALGSFLMGALTLGIASWLGYSTYELGWIGYAAWVPVFLGLAGYMARSRPQCSYVGEKGLASHVKGPWGERHYLLCFDDAAELEVKEVANYVNGGYQGTNFELNWRSEDGAILFRIAGLRWDHGLFADTETPAWDYARAARAQWTKVRLRRAQGEPEAHRE